MQQLWCKLLGFCSWLKHKKYSFLLKNVNEFLKWFYLISDNSQKCTLRWDYFLWWKNFWSVLSNSTGVFHCLHQSACWSVFVPERLWVCISCGSFPVTLSNALESKILLCIYTPGSVQFFVGSRCDISVDRVLIPLCVFSVIIKSIYLRLHSTAHEM